MFLWTIGLTVVKRNETKRNRERERERMEREEIGQRER